MMLTRTLRLVVALSILFSSTGRVLSAAQPVGGECWDLRDFARFQREFTGSTTASAPIIYDLNLDGRVDLSDYTLFLRACEQDPNAPRPAGTEQPTHPLGHILLWLLFMLVIYVAATHAEPEDTNER